MAEYIELTEELNLAMRAGARAISNTKKYHGTIFVADLFSNNPKEMPYLNAADILYAASETKPAADVAPVRHGRWLPFRVGFWTSVFECSECHRRVTLSCDEVRTFEMLNRRYPFCHCGAKMDLEASDGKA